MAARLISILALFLTKSFADQASLNAALFEAAKNEDINAAREALKAGADINAKEERGGQTPLMQSVLFGREGMVKFFLEENADVYVDILLSFPLLCW